LGVLDRPLLRGYLAAGDRLLVDARVLLLDRDADFFLVADRAAVGASSRSRMLLHHDFLSLHGHVDRLPLGDDLLANLDFTGFGRYVSMNPPGRVGRGPARNGCHRRRIAAGWPVPRPSDRLPGR